MSQTELADILGYKNRSSITKVESGVNDLPQSKIHAFAEALQTTSSYLMGWTDDPYDYDSDPDNRMAQIPIAMYEHWRDMYGDDNAAVWRAWVAYNDATKDEAMREMAEYNPTQRIPILGRISAGQPLFADEHIEGYTYTDLNHGHQYFALHVYGDSMDAAGVKDGYTVVIRRQDSVDNGEIAAVIVGDDEATLKRFYQNGNTVTLMPQSTNPAHLPQIYDISETRIIVLGKAVEVKFALN